MFFFFWVFCSDFSLCITKRGRPVHSPQPEEAGTKRVREGREKRGKLLCAVEEMLVLFMFSIVSVCKPQARGREEVHGKRIKCGVL